MSRMVDIPAWTYVPVSSVFRGIHVHQVSLIHLFKDAYMSLKENKLLPQAGYLC